MTSTTAKAAELLRQGRTADIWQTYCGFIEFTPDEFMHIQRRLLLEQLELLQSSALGRRLLCGHKPGTVEEFRAQVPLTTYHDYLPELADQREDALPARPVTWVRTSGRTGEFPCKWVPVPKAFYDSLGHYFLATQILSGARDRGHVNIAEDDVYLYTVAPPPYLSGTILRAGRDEFPFRFVPSIEEAEGMEFQARMARAFQLAMESGIDYFLGIGSVLIALGEAFSKRSGSVQLSRDMLQPAAIARMARGFLRSRLRGEPLQPRHFWNPKGITVGGMDVQLYRKRIEELWGVGVFEGYGCTEFGNVAVQSWGGRSKGMVPSADCAFWEFMPEGEYQKWRQDRSFQPVTYLTDELEPGLYVLVGTSLLGGVFVRYILGDLVRVLSTSDPELGIHLPEIVVESRVDDLIDLGSMVMLTERSLWQAFAYLDLPMSDWVARKETSQIEGPLIHLYIESENGRCDNLRSDLHGALVDTMDDYRTTFGITQQNPVRVTVLTPGTFQAYLEAKRQEGAELGHLKPPRMQPSDATMARLTALSDAARNGHRQS
ncbi:MAG: GH3 auxin-responsive promoter family protein [Nitrososphaerales archaeon]